MAGEKRGEEVVAGEEASNRTDKYFVEEKEPMFAPAFINV